MGVVHSVATLVPGDQPRSDRDVADRRQQDRREQKRDQHKRIEHDRQAEQQYFVDIEQARHKRKNPDFTAGRVLPNRTALRQG